MKFGLVMPQHGGFASRETLETMARLTDDAGFDSIWCADHVVIPHALVDRFSESFFELFSTLGFLAGVTRRVQLGTTVIVLPYRHPVALAKAMASVDALSGGRTLYGVAFGWVREEYEILDVPFERRGARADEMLQIIDRLWSDGFGFIGTSSAIRRNLDTARELGLEHIVLNPWHTIPGRIHEKTLDTVRATTVRFIEELLPDYLE